MHIIVLVAVNDFKAAFALESFEAALEDETLAALAPIMQHAASSTHLEPGVGEKNCRRNPAEPGQVLGLEESDKGEENFESQKPARLDRQNEE